MKNPVHQSMSGFVATFEVSLTTINVYDRLLSVSTVLDIIPEGLVFPALPLFFDLRLGKKGTMQNG
jgi:hypothetical protein